MSLSFLISVFCSMIMRPSPASDPESYNKLKASSDALRAQQREVMRSYSEVRSQIDQLRHQQALLENYLGQLDQSIRDVDRAMDALR